MTPFTGTQECDLFRKERTQTQTMISPKKIVTEGKSFCLKILIYRNERYYFSGTELEQAKEYNQKTKKMLYLK